MGDVADSDFPAALCRAQRKIGQWRQRHRPRARIPEELWREVAELASAYGINRTARALRLDYYSVKKRVAATAGSGKRVAATAGSGKRVAGTAGSGKRVAGTAGSGKRVAAARGVGKRVAAAGRPGQRTRAVARFGGVRSGKLMAVATGSGKRVVATARPGKRVVAGVGPGERRDVVASPGERAPAFVELLHDGMAVARPECTIEVEDGSGVTIRIRLQGGRMPDVSALVADMAALAGVLRQGRR